MKAANKITNWTYDKPTEAGDYFCCYGDVETPANVEFERYTKVDGVLETELGFRPRSYSNSFKFARLIYAPTELKAMECEE